MSRAPPIKVIEVLEPSDDELQSSNGASPPSKRRVLEGRIVPVLVAVGSSSDGSEYAVDALHAPSRFAKISPPKEDQGHQPPFPKFCWICHYENADYGCQTCPRSFHRECVKGFNERKRNGQTLECCQECVFTNVAFVTAFPELRRLSHEEIVLLLLVCCDIATDWISRESKICKVVEAKQALAGIESAEKADKNELEEMRRCLIKVVCMKTVQESVKRREIRTVEGFVGELKWIYHNSVIFYGRLDCISQIFSRFLTDVLLALKNMVNNCVECQLYKATKEKDRPPGYFLVPCKILHPVIWARLSGFPHWPAKLINFNFHDESCDVFFFQDHTHARLKLVHCATYSILHPDPKKVKPKDSKFNAAVKEANEYMKVMGRSSVMGPQVLVKDPLPLPDLTFEYIEKYVPQIGPLLAERDNSLYTLFDLDK